MTEKERIVSVISGIIGSDSRAVQFIAALHNAGLACVPIEPTRQMLEAGWAPAHDENAAETWKAMIEIYMLRTPAEP